MSAAEVRAQDSRWSEIQNEFTSGWLLSGFILFSAVGVHKLVNIDDKHNFEMPPALKKVIVIVMVFISTILSIAVFVEHGDHFLYGNNDLIRTNKVDEALFWLRESVLAVWIVVQIIFGRYIVTEQYS